MKQLQPLPEELGTLTLLALMVLLNEVRCQIEKDYQRRFVRDWLICIPKSEVTALGVLRWLAERFLCSREPETTGLGSRASRACSGHGSPA
jgi:hypothetical protein